MAPSTTRFLVIKHAFYNPIRKLTLHISDGQEIQVFLKNGKSVNGLVLRIAKDFSVNDLGFGRTLGWTPRGFNFRSGKVFERVRKWTFGPEPYFETWPKNLKPHQNCNFKSPSGARFIRFQSTFTLFECALFVKIRSRTLYQKFICSFKVWNSNTLMDQNSSVHFRVHGHFLLNKDLCKSFSFELRLLMHWTFYYEITYISFPTQPLL